MNKEQVKTLLIEQGNDNEIYSDESVDHETALLEFLSEKGVEVSPLDLLEKVEAPFIDADSVAGVRAVITIVSLNLEVHMVAFHHKNWDYYINEVKESEKTVSVPDTDVILLQNELEGGLNQKSIQFLASMMNDDLEYIPFSTADNNSSAHGFIRASTLEAQDWDSTEIQSFVKEIIGDMEKENENGYYQMPNGITLYIGYAVA